MRRPFIPHSFNQTSSFEFVQHIILSRTKSTRLLQQRFNHNDNIDSTTPNRPHCLYTFAIPRLARPHIHHGTVRWPGKPLRRAYTICWIAHTRQPMMRASRISRLQPPTTHVASALGELSESQHNVRDQTGIPVPQSFSKGVKRENAPPVPVPEPKRKPLSERAAEYPAKPQMPTSSAQSIRAVKGQTLATMSTQVRSILAASDGPVSVVRKSTPVDQRSGWAVSEHLQSGGPCRPPRFVVC